MLAKFISMLRFQVTTNRLLVVASLYFALIINIPFLQRFIGAAMAVDGYNPFFIATIPLLLWLLNMLILVLFSSRYLLKPVLTLLLLISSMMCFTTFTYGTVFDYSMIENVFETDLREATSYWNLHFLLFFTLTGALPVALVWGCRIVYAPLRQEGVNRAKLVAASLVGVMVIFQLYYVDYASVGRNNDRIHKLINPYPGLVSGYKFVRNRYLHDNTQFRQLDSAPQLLAAADGKKQVVVMVLGETARAANYQYNGYQRDTNRYTYDAALVAFQNVTSCGTATAISVPCMFSALNKNDYDKYQAKTQQNLLDLAAMSGVDVLWVDNNSGCKGVCNRVVTERIEPTSDDPLCDGTYCLDEAVLLRLQNKLADLKADKTLVVLHLMGSHGPTYYRRYPLGFAGYQPSCERSDIQNCSQEQLVNTYDNTILYTDYVIAQVLNQLQQLPEEIDTAMFYVSDHGESLGEDGAYLHGFPYAMAPKEQTHVPLLFWQREEQHSMRNCLNGEAAGGQFSHDNVFHSMLGLLQIKTTAYDIGLDLFASCRQHLLAEQKMMSDKAVSL